MSKRKPLKINYMDMKIPFNNFRIPKAKSEQLKLIERFEFEFGENYRLDELLDPIADIEDNGKPTYAYGSIEEKIERIRRRNDCVKGLAKAISENDVKKIKMYNFLRNLPALPGSDDGWNVAYEDNMEGNDDHVKD